MSISKTRVLSYLQCPRRLWLEQYSPELEDESAIDQAALATGRVVGEMARQVYGRGAGVLVDHNRGLRSAIAETEALLAAGGSMPIFEATFDYDGLTVQVDVLDRSTGAPRIVEVKSSTSVKDHFLPDCAVQTWTLRQAGIELAGTALALIDNEFVYRGDGDYSGLFHEVDLTDDLAGLVATVPELVERTRATLDSLDEPEQVIGEHCQKPYTCPFFEHCAPEQGEYPILGLGGRKEPLFELMRSGFKDVRELRPEQLPSESQQRIWQQTVAGEPYLSHELKGFVGGLAYPRFYLDFETIAFAIPIWTDTRPYEALPFQWSCHIDDGQGSIRHEEFLDLSGEPPMQKLTEALLAMLGEEGPIVVYTPYEKRVLSALAERYPAMRSGLEAVIERIVDLYPVAKAHYYHPEMQGSWSIKAILPTIGAGIDYASLDEVTDGEAAQTAYLEAIHGDTSETRRAVLRDALLAYCKLDTEALVRLVGFFARQS